MAKKKGQQSASPADNEDVTKSAAASTATQDDNPDSSPESETETEETFGDVIDKALKPETADEDTEEGEETPGEESEEDAGEEADEGTEEESDEDPGEKTQRSKADKSKEQSGEETEDDEHDDLPEGKRVPYDRFKKVNDERKQFREQAETLAQERDQYQEGHKQYEAIQHFMRENELRTEDVVEALTIAAAINNDPARAAEMLGPKWQQLQRFTGDILPDDLRQRVDQGELAEDAARELARRRNQETLDTERRRREDQRRSQESQNHQVAATQQAMAESANAEQRRLMESDPDWNKKDPWVRKELHMLISQRQPSTAEEAAALVREAHKNVTRDLQKLVPGKPDIRRSPSSTQGGGSPGAAKEPESMSEAIDQALSQQ